MIKYNKLNDIDYINRWLEFWYIKCNESIFKYFFNKFAKYIILCYLNNTHNKNLLIKYLKNDKDKDIFEHIKLYKYVAKDILKTFNDDDDNLSFELFEEVVF